MNFHSLFLPRRFGPLVIPFLALALCAFLPARMRAASSSRPPNIILVGTDSWDGRAFGFLGHPAMKRATPNIDRLARRGTVLKNTYCSSPICVPSRASTWSGQYLWHCEAWNNYKGLPPGTLTVFSHLQRGGYTLASPEGGFGKMDYVSGSHSLMNRLAAWTAPAGIELPILNVKPLVVRPDRDPRLLEPEEPEHRDDWEAVDRGKAFLREHRDDAQPFFLYVSVNKPHPPFVTNERYLAMIDQDAITLPPADAEVHPVMRYQQVTKNWPFGFDPETVRKTRAIYYAMCAETDTMVGELLDEMDRLGLAENTYFIFTSDHGENALEHGQWYKMNMYESSVRVPLIVAGPGVQRGVILPNLVSQVDLFPTVAELAGQPTPKGLDGESLVPLLTGRTTRSRETAMAMYTDFLANTTITMFRRGDWKYVVYPGYEPQLFNLARDPDEIHDLARSEPARREEMAAALKQIVDVQAVHRRVVTYDKNSFLEWRKQAKAGPVPNIDSTGQPVKMKDGKIQMLTYADAMKMVYHRWTAAEEEKLDAWLAKP